LPFDFRLNLQWGEMLSTPIHHKILFSFHKYIVEKNFSLRRNSENQFAAGFCENQAPLKPLMSTLRKFRPSFILENLVTSHASGVAGT